MANDQKIQLKPDDFPAYLCDELGFELLHTLNAGSNGGSKPENTENKEKHQPEAGGGTAEEKGEDEEERKRKKKQKKKREDKESKTRGKRETSQRGQQRVPRPPDLKSAGG